MNKIYIIGALLLVGSFCAGYSAKRCEDCNKVRAALIDSLNASTAKIDSLKHSYENIIASIKPVTNDPDTIITIVNRRHRLQRIAGVDSSEKILFSDPK